MLLSVCLPGSVQVGVVTIFSQCFLQAKLHIRIFCPLSFFFTSHTWSTCLSSCDSQPPRWSPMISTCWYSHLCIFSFHTVPGVGPCEIQQSDGVSLLRLGYNRLQLRLGLVLAWIIYSGRAPSHLSCKGTLGIPWRSPCDKELRSPANNTEWSWSESTDFRWPQSHLID